MKCTHGDGISCKGHSADCPANCECCCLSDLILMRSLADLRNAVRNLSPDLRESLSEAIAPAVEEVQRRRGLSSSRSN